MCGRDGVLLVIGDRPKLLSGMGHGYALALDGEEITCLYCSRMALGLPLLPDRKPRSQSWKFIVGDYSQTPEAIKSRRQAKRRRDAAR